MPRKFVAAGLLFVILIAACSSAPSPTDQPTDAAQTESPLESVARIGSERPAWLTMPLINANTSQTFTLSDFPNQTVYVELMATWCTNCRIQQGNVKTVREQLSQQDYVFISLSVEPKDTTPGLAQYTQQYSYPWTFAVAPTEMVAALVEQFGQSVTNPTATPHFLISPNGSVSQLSTGINSTDQLTAELTTASGA